MVVMGKGQPFTSNYILVLIQDRMWMWDQFFTFHYIKTYDFLTIYCHSPGGDAAAALSYTAFYMAYINVKNCGLYTS